MASHTEFLTVPTHPPRSTQLCSQFLLQHAAGPNEEAAIDRFVRYLHVLVGCDFLLQPARDLLRRPLQRELLRHAPSQLPVQRQTTRLGAQRPLPSTPISTPTARGGSAVRRVFLQPQERALR